MLMEFINDIDYYDQHFLIDKEVLNDFIDACEISIQDEIVEIGPGKGVITELLAKKGKHVTCIEMDLNLEHFINVLKEKYNNIDVIYGNALNVYLPSCDKVISALPYSITEPFIEKLLRCDFNESILIVGKRFADNVCENKLTKLSLLTNSFFDVYKVRDVLPSSFDPMPRVMSSIIKLKKVKREDLKYSYKRFIFREMFFNRDRKLKNNLMEALIEFSKLHDKKLTKKESKEIVKSFNIPDDTLNKRMENLSNSEYTLIYESLK